MVHIIAILSLSWVLCKADVSLVCQPGEQPYNNSTCIKCPVGQQNPTGSGNCTDCTPGKYANFFGTAVCSDCLPGRYTPPQPYGAISCTLCPLGKFASGNGSVSCDVCPSGSATSTPASTSCTLCTPGTFANYSGSSACSACPSGSTSVIGATNCTSVSSPCGDCGPHATCASVPPPQSCMCDNGFFGAPPSVACTTGHQFLGGDSILDHFDDIFGHPAVLRPYYIFHCPTAFSIRPIWGTAWYTLDSDVCTAALHAMGQHGGFFVAEIVIDLLKAPGDRVQVYTSSSANNVTSLSYNFLFPVAFRYIVVDTSHPFPSFLTLSTKSTGPMLTHVIQSLAQAHQVKSRQAESGKEQAALASFLEKEVAISSAKHHPKKRHHKRHHVLQQ